MKFARLAKLKKILKKSIPLWMVVLLILESSAFIGLGEYLVFKQNLNNSILNLAKTTKTSDELALILKQKVLPQKGYVLAAEWKDVGRMLLKEGAIDEKKYKELFVGDEVAIRNMWHLENKSDDHMFIDEKGSRFMVNTLWALGLINKTRILDKGSMMSYPGSGYMSYASTGGWTLGMKDASVLYSSKRIVPLTEKQEAVVENIAKTIYRPCCDNHTEFPDCNHGMAALGYIELAVSQGISEGRIYKDILALNSFWFPQNYVEIAAYFDQQKVDWKDIDPKKVLSAEFSSGSGSNSIKQKIQNSPLINTQGGGCGA